MRRIICVLMSVAFVAASFSATAEPWIEKAATAISGSADAAIMSSGKFYINKSADTSNQVPDMTSNTAPSGIASTDSSYSSSYAAWNAFDRDTASTWSSALVALPRWLAYEFTSAKTITRVTMTMVTAGGTAANLPKDFTIDGWDGGAWVTLSTQTGITGWTAGGTKTFTFSNSTAYIKYRMHCTATGAGTGTKYVELGEFTLHLF